ncbi:MULTISPECIES: tetratricopeptide repeat protein [Methylobacterium]|jgi:uncharacterized protein|uniref:tetratricopeptide repeat protein n=1 Tax=Methylobacterium TaxID=407 RepID=UPI0009F8A086|nr:MULTISPECIES: tetratricopeptide repeat protein [Methylobacterium]NGM37371.1 sel1 repeat family protein [Methylobacterium sp. DB0501]UHC20275.1 sel1 repeat family protein [Methylobacterium currus]
MGTAEPALWELHHNTEADWRRILDGSPDSAARWIRFAAERGFRSAQVVLGQMLLDGHGVPRDPTAAFTWFRRAASIGSLDACNMVGRCHELGWGVPASHAEALSHYRRAAAGGHAWGLYNTGCLLLYGDVRRDHAEAFRCFSAAAERDEREASSKALGMLARCHEEGWGTPVNRVAALRCYRAATAAGDCWAALNLGMIHTENDRVAEAHAAFETALAHATPHCLPMIVSALNDVADPRLAGLIADAMSRAQQLDGMQMPVSLPYHKRDALQRHKAAWILKTSIIAAYLMKLLVDSWPRGLS